jgi:predicted deacylase
MKLAFDRICAIVHQPKWDSLSRENQNRAFPKSANCQKIVAAFEAAR